MTRYCLTQSVALLLAVVPLTTKAAGSQGDDRPIRHVLLISIDGMHALDYLNCSKGIAGVNGGQPYCPQLARLGETATTYVNASTSKPSDSFPGLMAIVSGGSPLTTGAFYDVAYDRSLDPPAKTTGNGVAGGSCTPGVPPTGTTTEYDEGIDIDQTKLNGGAPAGSDGGLKSIDPEKLIRDPGHDCAPVFPWNFVRTNTVFGVIHAAGGYTAWCDKHPSYSSVSGPGNGGNLDDYYSPEINSTVVGLPGVTTPLGMSCSTVPDPSQVGAWTDSFANIQCYDTLKVNAVLNEIAGKTHSGSASAPVPELFGMNFQVVSVGQKLIEKGVATGGYLDANGTPSPQLLGEIRFADAAIGEMVSQLSKNKLLDSTLIVITAKHGQSPIDPGRFLPIPGPSGKNGKSPATILASLLPESESPANPNGIGPTEDDVSLLWLADSRQTTKAVGLLEANASLAGIGEIFAGAAVTELYDVPGLPPTGDPRTPDIIVTPNIGVVYTSSGSKLAEHGGFSHDDTNVMMLVSNSKLKSTTIASPVETAQVAPTILKALGLDPDHLEAVQKEGTQILPGVFGDNDH
ncbi:MAG TPA: alkaline phosphatase family protein [Anaeromyxobacteraceae bacterium]|nr:alkaline phosphatase family protein [Anaeromyxobacteraceae bacterium]